jgi:hypothetical protein
MLEVLEKYKQNTDHEHGGPTDTKKKNENTKLRTSYKLQTSEPTTLKGSNRQFNVDNIRRENRNCTNTYKNPIFTKIDL